MKLPVVLNTRPREQAAELSQLLQSVGLLVVEAPAIAIVSAWDDAELETVRRDLASSAYAWVVLASLNAGRRLAGELHNTRVVCGTGTARALGLRAAIALEPFSARAVLDALRPRLSPGDRVLLPHAVEGREELFGGLSDLGASVHAPVAYRTVAVSDAAERLLQGGIDVVTVCSPSAVRSVAPAVTSRMMVVCLGETTAEAARDAGLRVVAIASSTTMAALVDAVRLALGHVIV